MTATATVEKARRGRKPGSKNRPKDQSALLTPKSGAVIEVAAELGIPAKDLSLGEKKEKLFAPTYKRIEVEIELVGRMYGGLPQAAEQLRAWIEAKGPIPEETIEDKLAVTPALTEEQITTKVEASSTVFRADDKGLFVRDFMVKQMLKECATVLGLTQKKIGSKTILTIGMVVEPERIRPYRNTGFSNETKTTVREHDGFEERDMLIDGVTLRATIRDQDGWEEFQGRVRTMQGPRNILSRKAYLEAGTKFAFTIEFLKTDKVTEDDLKILLTHAGKFVGFGSARSREAGKFKMTRFDVV